MFLTFLQTAPPKVQVLKQSFFFFFLIVANPILTERRNVVRSKQFIKKSKKKTS